MAKAIFAMPEEFLTRISRLAERTDEIVPKVLEAGGKVVLAKVKSNLSAAIGRGKSGKSRSTDQLAAALGLSPAKLNRDGNFDVKIGFAEPRRDGGSNAKLANILEYGKHGQPPHPFLKPAKSAAKGECVEAMKAKLEEEIGSI